MDTNDIWVEWLDHLQGAFEQAIQELLQDPLMKAFSVSENTHEFMLNRVQEVIQESLGFARDQQLERVAEDFMSIQKRNEKLEEMLDHMEKNYSSLSRDRVGELKSDIVKLSEDHHRLKEQLKETYQQMMAFKKENKMLLSEIIFLSLYPMRYRAFIRLIQKVLPTKRENSLQPCASRQSQKERQCHFGVTNGFQSLN